MSDGIPCPICRMEALPDGDGYVVCYNCEDPYHANMMHKSRWEVANKEYATLRSRVEELEAELKRYIPSQWRAKFEAKEEELNDCKSELARTRVEELERLLIEETPSQEMDLLEKEYTNAKEMILEQSYEIDHLREQVRWIPSKERDPEYDGFYHVLLFVNATLLEDFVEYSNDKWHNIYVKYWTPGLPLPEPPKEEE